MSNSGSVIKTVAMEEFCLSAKDLESLTHEERPNRRYKNATPTKLYKRSELEALAAAKWGSVEAASEEREKRADRRQKRAVEKTQSELARPAKAARTEAAALGIPGVTADGELPTWLSERIRRVQAGSEERAGDCVLYWMSTAVRAHENPALDVAKAHTRRRGLPVVVAAFLLPTHTYPTARRLKFWLEGFRDAQAELRAQGIELLVFLEGHTQLASSGGGSAAAGGGADAMRSQSSGWQALLQLAGRAAVVVVEDMPVSPEAAWLRDLQQDAPPDLPILAVDSACVMPMQLVHCSTEKAYIYRSTTQQPRRQRIESMPYSDAGDLAKVGLYARAAAAASQGEENPEPLGEAANPASQQDPGHTRGPVLPDLGWEPLDLTAEGLDIDELLKGCAWVDQGVPGITHSIGGSTAAYARWELFKRGGLNAYASTRNTPMKRNGVSRQSAYHHFGMISPFKVARDAHASKSSGAAKFFDEFETWREISYAACSRAWPHLEGLEALPDWARKTLQKHASDSRPHLMSDEQLEGCTTGDAMWDAAQHQLNVTGELHNNVRMSWGKALIPWSRDPETALKRALYLNHKYALDGCDPASYSGILWCFGKHDKPKQADSTPIFGSVASRPMHVVARKMAAAAYRDLAIDPDHDLPALGQQASPAAGSKEPQKSIKNFFTPKAK